MISIRIRSKYKTLSDGNLLIFSGVNFILDLFNFTALKLLFVLY